MRFVLASSVPVSLVTVWGATPVFVQVTVSPTFTVTLAGVKLKSAMETDALAALALRLPRKSAPPPRTTAKIIRARLSPVRCVKNVISVVHSSVKWHELPNRMYELSCPG